MLKKSAGVNVDKKYDFGIAPTPFSPSTSMGCASSVVLAEFAIDFAALIDGPREILALLPPSLRGYGGTGAALPPSLILLPRHLQYRQQARSALNENDQPQPGATG
jgi:hypothetical protein